MPLYFVFIAPLFSCGLDPTLLFFLSNILPVSVHGTYSFTQFSPSPHLRSPLSHMATCLCILRAGIKVVRHHCLAVICFLDPGHSPWGEPELTPVVHIKYFPTPLHFVF